VLATIILQSITGDHTPACLFAANHSVEAVTPPSICNPERLQMAEKHGQMPKFSKIYFQYGALGPPAQ